MIIARFSRASDPIDIPELLPVGAGVSRVTLTSASIPSYWSGWGTDATYNATAIPVIANVSVFAYNTTVVYGAVDTLAECLAEYGKYYYNATTQTLYINFDGINDAAAQVLVSATGSVTGYTNQETVYINDVEYAPYLRSIPSVNKTVDPISSGKMSFQNQTVEIVNSSGEQDAFIVEPIPGSVFDLVNYESGAETPIYSGYVVSDNYGIDTTNFTISDTRERASVACPTAVFDATTYPYIDDKLVGEVIPDIYGNVRGVECYCMNSEQTASSYTFRPCLTMTTLTTVYVKGDNDTWTARTPTSTDLAGGTFVLASSDCTNSSGKVLDVKANLTGRDLHSAPDIIKDINSRYGGVSFNSTNYDLAEWNDEAAKIGGSCYLVMAEQNDLYSWIEELQNAAIRQFVFDITPFGKRTLRVNEPNRTDSFNLESWQFIDSSGERDFQFYASRVNVYYARDFMDEFAPMVFNNDYESDRAQAYSKLQDYTVESDHVGLDNITDADAKADVIAEAYEPRMVFRVTMFVDDPAMFGYLKLFATGIMDFSQLEPLPPVLSYLLTSSGEYVLTSDGERILLGSGSTIYAGRQFFGQQRVIIEGINYNLSEGTVEVTARARPNIS